MGKPANAQLVPVEPGKTTAELFADRYFEQFQQIRGAGYSALVPGPAPELEAE